MKGKMDDIRNAMREMLLESDWELDDTFEDIQIYSKSSLISIGFDFNDIKEYDEHKIKLTDNTIIEYLDITDTFIITYG